MHIQSSFEGHGRIRPAEPDRLYTGQKELQGCQKQGRRGRSGGQGEASTSSQRTGKATIRFGRKSNKQQTAFVIDEHREVFNGVY